MHLKTQKEEPLYLRNSFCVGGIKDQEKCSSCFLTFVR